MELKFECPNCEQHILATTDQGGLEAACPGCNETVVVPMVHLEPPPVQSLPPLPPSLPVRAEIRPEHSSFSPQSPSTLPATLPPKRSWLPLYVVASSALIVVLLCVLIFRGPTASNQSWPASNPSADASLRDARQVTEELQKQHELQATLIERQKNAEQQRLQAAEAQRQQEAAAEEQRRLAAEEQRKKEADEAVLNAAKVRIGALENQIARMQESLEQTQANSEELKTNVENYILDHKMATTALMAGIGGAGVALDSSNHFSDDAKAIGTLGAVAAGLWMLSDGDNVKEVVQVGSELTKASNTQDRYMKEITNLKQQIKLKEAEKAKLATSTKCSSCGKTILVIREHWHTTFTCPFCKASLKLSNPPD